MMSGAYASAVRTATRACRAQPSLAARPALRQSRRFFSAARPEPHPEQNWRRPSWIAERLLIGAGIGVGWVLGEQYMGSNTAVKAEAIDLGDAVDSSPPANLKPKTSKSKTKAKAPEKPEPTSDASQSKDDAIPPPKPEVEAGAGEEESSGGAFNPETGEINWDCPCLGGMAHGPCGEEFRAAFSCFVFSEAEPKGIECVEKFKGMQDCFRAHPEVYGEEIMADDDEDGPAPSPSGTDSPALESSELSPMPDIAGAPTPAPVPSSSVPSSPSESS